MPEPSEELRDLIHEGEDLKFVVKPDKRVLFLSQAGGRAVVAVALGVLVAVFGVPVAGEATDAVPVTTLSRAAAFAAVVALLLAGPLARVVMLHAEYAATDERLIDYGGLYGRSLDSIPFEGIQDAEFDVSAAGRVFDVGEVTVDTAVGYEEMTMEYVPDPNTVATNVTELASEVETARPDPERVDERKSSDA